MAFSFKKFNHKSYFKKLISLLVLLLLVVSFQNCTNSVLGSGKLSLGGYLTKTDNNGTGYDGKIEGYTRLVPGFSCKDNQVSVGSINLGTDTASIVTNENFCQGTATVVPLSDLEFSSFTKKYIGYDGGVFTYLEDRKENISKRIFTEVWCKSGSGTTNDVVKAQEIAIEWEESGKLAKGFTYTSKTVAPLIAITDRKIGTDRVVYEFNEKEKLTIYFSRQAIGRQKVRGVYGKTFNGSYQEAQMVCLMGGQFDRVAPQFNYSNSSEKTLAVGEKLIDMIPNTNKASVTYSLNATLPDGLNFNSNTGEISGLAQIPTARKKIMVTAKFDFGEISRLISIGIGSVQAVDQSVINPIAGPCANATANCDLAGAIALANKQAPIPLILKITVPEIKLNGTEILVTGDLSIIGQTGWTTINASQLSRHFNLAPASSLAVKNLNLINGKSIYGGSIYVDKGILIVDNSTFSNNYAGTSDSSDQLIGQGGAIFAINSSIELVNSSFTNNQTRHSGSNVSGGAVYIQGGEKTTIVNTSFNYNYADKGGAVYLSTISHPVLFENSIFNANSAGDGGAIFMNHSAEFLIRNSQFVNNRANFHGAAIAAKFIQTGSVVQTKFDGNKTDFTSAAAIYWWGMATSEWFEGSARLYLLDSQFINHSASSFGGAVIVNQTGEIVLRGTEFRDNGPLKNCAATFEAPTSEYLSLGGNYSSDNSCPP